MPTASLLEANSPASFFTAQEGKACARYPYPSIVSTVYYAAMNRTWLGIGAINGALAVIAGAFSVHGLQGHVSPQSLSVFETGARYHMYHALAIALAALVPARAAAAAFLAGIVLFSGSLYVLALTGLHVAAFFTPVGGLCFIVGWILLAWAAFRSPI
jgi:uncharacterized membrane protein YgdD (TMEM256/DUF423 family)